MGKSGCREARKLFQNLLLCITPLVRLRRHQLFHKGEKLLQGVVMPVSGDKQDDELI